jgi:SAM-dependent methyltransferase
MTTETARGNFGAAAADYATNSYHAAGPDLRMLVEAAALTGGERVLDVGTGAGHTAMAVAAAREVVGVDVTPEMLSAARNLARERKLSNVRFEEADATALPYEDCAFDLVTNRQSCHHYHNLPKAIAETARVLRPGGRFLLIDTVAPEDAGLDTFLNTVEFLRDHSHVRDWRATEWIRMLAAAGLEGQVLQRFPIVLDGMDWVRRMRTPDTKVAMIRELFRDATAAQRAAFELRNEEPWGLSLPAVLIDARKP